MLKVVGVILPVLHALLFLASLLTVFKAPTYHLWLLAIAVTEFPLIFISVTGLLLVACFWIEKHQAVLTVMGLFTLVLFTSPIIRAYIVASGLKQGFSEVFGERSTSIKGNDNSAPFSFFNMLKTADNSVKYTTLTYTDSLTLDYYPSQLGGKKPCIVIIHGGSWSSGDSKQLPELNTYLAKAGYNIASINYHLATKYQAPVAIEDVHGALKYLCQHAVELHIDTNNFVLLGRSAGAQIALLSAYNRPYKGVKGVVNFYGPADMVWGYSKPASKLVMDSRGVMERYLGGTYAAVPDKYLASSPIAFVSVQTVPTLTIHGDNDVLVSPIHSTKLDAELTAKGVQHYNLVLPWATHGFDYNLNGPGGQLATYVVERFIHAICK